MTETDTSRQTAERPCRNCGVTLDGWSGLRNYGYYTTHNPADCMANLRLRAEKAEAERDTAWNDAIEAAAECVGHITQSEDRDAIMALKEGDTP